MCSVNGAVLLPLFVRGLSELEFMGIEWSGDNLPLLVATSEKHLRQLGDYAKAGVWICLVNFSIASVTLALC